MVRVLATWTGAGSAAEVDLRRRVRRVRVRGDLHDNIAAYVELGFAPPTTRMSATRPLRRPRGIDGDACAARSAAQESRSGLSPERQARSSRPTRSALTCQSWAAARS